MSQQLNLLDASLRPRREWLTLVNLAIAVVAALLLLGAAAGLGWMREAEQRARSRGVEADMKRSQEALMLLAGEQSRRHSDPALEASLADAKRLLAGKLDVMAALERGGLGERSGFARYLQGFARQTLDGVWLTGFDLAAGGRSLEIRGRMRQEALLPLYVQQLNQEPVFQGRRFAALDMHRPDAEKAAGNRAGETAATSPHIEFVLAGEAAKPAATNP